MKKFLFVRHPFWATLSLFAAGGIVYIVVQSTRPAPPPELITVTRGTITQEVTVAGTAKAAETIDLGFTKNGRVKAVNVEVGSTIYAGQILAELDSSQLKAQLDQAAAGIASAEAKLGELLKGTREEQIALSRTGLANAETAANDAEQGLRAAISSAATNADDAVHNETDVLFINPRTSPQLIFGTGNSQLKSDVERSRAGIEVIFASWKTGTTTLTVLAEADMYLVDLNKIRDYFDLLSSFVNSLTTGGGLDATTIASHRASVSTARTAVNTAVTALTAAREKMNTALANVETAKSKLALDEAGATQEQIAAAEAAVHEATANAAALKVQLDDSVLRSPLAGTVTKVNVAVGEIVPPNTAVISAISSGMLKIEANVPEVDIGKVHVGNSVQITFDAFPGETFGAKVAYIDPAETIVEGVVSYKITVLLDSRDKRVKSGLTANLAIQTLTKPDVIVVPQFGILQTDEGTFAQKWENGATVQISIVIGIQGKDSLVEVVSGLNEGDKIVNVGLKAESK